MIWCVLHSVRPSEAEIIKLKISMFKHLQSVVPVGMLLASLKRKIKALMSPSDIQKYVQNQQRPTLSSLEEVKLSLLILSVSSNCCCWSINLSFCHKNTLHKSTLSPLFCVTRPDCKVLRARRQVLTPLPPLPTCFLSLCPSYSLISPRASLFFSKSNVIPPHTAALAHKPRLTSAG